MSLFRGVARSALGGAFTQRSVSSASAARFATAAGAAASGSGSESSSSGPWCDRASTPRLNRYLVVAEDFCDAGANARRFEVRERHLEHAQSGKRAGRIELGGALLRKDFCEIDQEVGAGPHMGGSVLVVLGESIQDVRDRVMKDEYVQGHVWDVEKIKIYPFLQAPLQTDAGADVATEPSKETRANANATLGQLRQDLAAGKGPKMITLGALRRMHQSTKPSH